MPDVALKAGIAWKNALVQANLTYVQEKEPGNTALIQRYKDELEILKRQNRRAYDLVKRNLDRVLRN